MNEDRRVYKESNMYINVAYHHDIDDQFDNNNDSDDIIFITNSNSNGTQSRQQLNHQDTTINITQENKKGFDFLFYF
jgi:hypothetical protein